MLIESMRDIGYSLESALADVVDNSITARARTVNVFADSTGSEPRIGVLDDGEGMTEEELLSAMRLGSRNPLDNRDRADLGRFGLGLKTATFSQCRRLTVATRREGVISVARGDLDHVAKTDEWLVQIPDDPGSIPWMPRLGDRGTLVVWAEGKADRAREWLAQARSVLDQSEPPKPDEDCEYCGLVTTKSTF